LAMALVKAKKFNIEDSNIEKLGSKEDKDARYKASQGENAWAGVGKEVGMWIWRIEKFQVVTWPKEQYGNFYTGDSYILLKSYKTDPEKPKISHDIHFWIGSDSSQDEYGTAAYKTVELDDYINLGSGSDPVQHRELESYESPAFLSYFPKGIKFLKGGVDSGFRHVEAKSYSSKLLQIKGKKHCIVREVELSGKSLNKGDIFILDVGLEMMEWIGSSASIAEKAKAAELIRAMAEERGGMVKITVYDEKASPPGKTFWDALGGKVEVAPAVPDDAVIQKPKKLFQLSDKTGKLVLSPVPVSKKSLESSDVFIFDIGYEVYVWVGKGATKAEKANGLSYATNYLFENKRPKTLPIARIVENGEPQAFFEALGSD